MSESTLPDSGARTQFETGAVRDAMTGKGLPSCIPPIALISLAKRFEDGAQKYSRGNFAKGIPLSRYYDAIFRHNYQWLSGCTKEDHLGAIMWNAAAALWTLEAIKRGVLPASLDDRFFDKDGVHHGKPATTSNSHLGSGALPAVIPCTQEHVDQARKFFEDVRRVLSPDGAATPKTDPNPALHGDEPGVQEAIQAARETLPSAQPTDAGDPPTTPGDDTAGERYEVFTPADGEEVPAGVECTAIENAPGCGYEALRSNWIAHHPPLLRYRRRIAPPIIPLPAPIIDDTDGGKYEVFKPNFTSDITDDVQVSASENPGYGFISAKGSIISPHRFDEFRFRRPVKKPDLAGGLASVQAQSLGMTPAPKPIYPSLPDDVYQDFLTWTFWRCLKAGDTLRIGDEARRGGTNWRQVNPNECTIILELDIENGFSYRRKWDTITRQDAILSVTPPTSKINPFGDTPANPSPLTPASE